MIAQTANGATHPPRRPPPAKVRPLRANEEAQQYLPQGKPTPTIPMDPAHTPIGARARPTQGLEGLKVPPIDLTQGPEYTPT
jgi:hypothetical protein